MSAIKMSTSKGKGQTESRLITALQQLFPDQSVTPANIRNPTKNFVVTYYLEFLRNIGVNIDKFCQVSPLMYEKFGDIYMIRKLTVTLHEVFSKIMFDEIAPFGMLDLLQPTQGRTTAFFLQMCNFIYFSIEKLNIIDNHIDELEEEKKEIDSLLGKREGLRHKLNEEANTRARISDLQTEVENKQQELRALNAEGDVLDKVTVEKENVIKNLEEELKQRNKVLSEVQQEMAKTEALIVRSPLSAKNQKCHLEQKLAEVLQEIDSVNEMLRKKSETSKKLETFGEELDSRINLLKKIIFEYKELSKDKELTEELQRKLSRTRENQDEMNVERQKLQEERARLQETESGLRLRYETKKKEFEGRMKVVKEDLTGLLQKADKTKYALQRDVNMSSEEVSHLVNVYSKLCKKYEELYKALLLKEKSVADEALDEVEEVCAKFEKNM